jgi:hypothetical protein
MSQLLIARSLCPDADWEKICVNESYRMSGLVREHLPGLNQILREHRRILFLATPGMGLSSLVLQVREHLMLAADSELVVVSLTGTQGDLNSILEVPAPAPSGELPSEIWYLLDDLKDVEPSHLPRLFDKLMRLDSDPRARIALFSTQGFAAANLSLFNGRFSRFYLLGLTSFEVQQICSAEEVGSLQFEDELERLDLTVEAGNPTVLRTLISIFKDHLKLPDTRTEVFEAILRSFSKSTGDVHSERRKALQALGLGMELASRTFLKPPEAELAIGARLDLSPSEANALLTGLSSFLVFTPEGIAFPHQSFGEFFAACELRDEPLGVILEFVFLPRSRTVNPSWRSALAYLAELHPGARRYLAMHHPELALATSLIVLTEADRTAISRNVYSRLRDRHEHILRHLEISGSRLARCLQAVELGKLEGDARQCADAIIASNGFILLGEAGVLATLPLALDTAFDAAIERTIREGAFHCIGCLGTPELIPELVAGIKPSDPCYISMLTSIGRLMDEESIPLVMSILLASQTLIAAAHRRLRRLQPNATALALLSMVRQSPSLTKNLRWNFYASCLLSDIRRAWNRDIEVAVSEALVAIEKAQVFDLHNDFIDGLAKAIMTHDRDEVVVRSTLRVLGERGARVVAIPRTLLRLSSAGTIRWLLNQSYGEPFVTSLWIYPRGELRQIFQDSQPMMSAAVDPEVIALEREHRALVEEADAAVARARTTVCEGNNFTQICEAVIFLGEDRLPDVAQQRLEWLRSGVEDHFSEVDFSGIQWKANACETPRVLYCLLILVRRYRLHLVDDRPLIKSLNGINGQAAEFHATNFGLSSRGQKELDNLVSNQHLDPGANYTVLSFLRQTCTWTPEIGEGLLNRSLRLDPELSEPAVLTLCHLPQSTSVLVNIASQKQVPVPDSVLDELVNRQHRPTIERRLSQVLSDDNLLIGGEVELPRMGPLDWIGSIRLPEVWGKLLKLRSRALNLGLSRLVGTVTNAMAKIDEARLASSMAGQLAQAPRVWRPWQQARAIESRQRSRLAQARAIDFVTVVTRLRMRSTNKLLKVWCEGVTDLPAMRTLLEKAIGQRDDVVFQPIGGWGELSNQDWPLDRLWDGCLDVVLIADGDNGRDWTRSDRMLSDAGNILMKRLKVIGVSGFILKRYGIENYFPKNAVEAVCGKLIAQSFPLTDHARAAEIPGYSKESNSRIADHMSLADLEGTDLLDIIQELRRRVEALE